MSDNWLEISDDAIDAGEIVRRIRERIIRRAGVSPSEEAESPAAIAEALWREMIGDPAGGSASRNHIAIRQRDCDIVPRSYVIDWRIPILGPVHALVRRIINAEIRRYLLPSLEKQSQLNQRMLRMLEDLVEENRRLRREIEELRETLDKP
jgi:hypothetical protein